MKIARRNNSAEIYYDMKGAFKFEKKDFPITCKVGKGESVKRRKGRAVVEAHHHGVVQRGHARGRGHGHGQGRGVEKVREMRRRSLGDMVR